MYFLIKRIEFPGVGLGRPNPNATALDLLDRRWKLYQEIFLCKLLLEFEKASHERKNHKTRVKRTYKQKPKDFVKTITHTCRLTFAPNRLSDSKHFIIPSTKKSCDKGDPWGIWVPVEHPISRSDPTLLSKRCQSVLPGSTQPAREPESKKKVSMKTSQPTPTDKNIIFNKNK